MSNQIPTNWVNTFRASFVMLAQQKESRLVSAVLEEPINGEFGYYDQIGVVEAVQRTTRHADTAFTEVPHSRRRVQAADWELGEIIDTQDTQRMLTDPQSSYVQAFAAAINRRKDRTIMEAFFADAATGKAGGSTVSFPAGNQIAVDYVESGSTTNSSLTVAKLRRARTILMDGEAAEDEVLYVACRAQDIQNLLRDTQVSSSDFNTIKALVNGEINTFMGFEFIRLPAARFTQDGSNHFRIPAWSKSGMWFAPLSGLEVNAAPDPTKGFNTRLHAKQSFGATRLEEARVVEIKCHATTL
jgi:hypothetical protein